MVHGIRRRFHGRIAVKAERERKKGVIRFSTKTSNRGLDGIRTVDLLWLGVWVSPYFQISFHFDSFHIHTETWSPL
jgi:hypothetical protein